jgi:hypothetical protein
MYFQLKDQFSNCKIDKDFSQNITECKIPAKNMPINKILSQSEPRGS